jgi:hypothetical protein
MLWGRSNSLDIGAPRMMRFPQFFLGGLFGGGKTTTTNDLVPQDRAWVDYMRRLGQQGVGAIQNAGPLVAGPNAQAQMGAGQIAGLMPGMSYGMQDWMNRNRSLADQLGFAGQQFGAGTLDAYMNPYQSQVIDAMNQQFDRSGQYALNAAKQQATGAGAYGGSRLGVMQAGALAQNEQARNAQIGNALQQGYGQAYNQWMQDRNMAAQLGSQGLGGMFSGMQYGNAWDMQRAQANMNAGEYMRNLQQQQMQEPLMRAQAVQSLAGQAMGPYGTTQTQQKSGSLFGGLLGAATTIGGLGGFGALGSLAGKIFGGGGDQAQTPQYSAMPYVGLNTQNWMGGAPNYFGQTGW